MTRPEWIEVGRVSRPHGVHGEVRVSPDSDNPERFVEGGVVYARQARPGLARSGAKERTRLTIQDIRGETEFPIVTFAEVDDREAAASLGGCVLEVRAEDLPELPADEYYPFDIEGLEVRDPEGSVVGRVREVIDSPAHAVLAVALASGGEALVPFVMAAVPEVVPREGYLVVRPEFLVET